MRKRGSGLIIVVILIVLAVLSSFLVLAPSPGDFICDVTDACTDAGQPGCTDVANKHPDLSGAYQCNQIFACCAQTTSGQYCQSETPLTNCAFSKISLPLVTSCLDTASEPRCEQ